MPDRYKPLPEVGDVPVGQDPADWVVVRNCGHGFELVSREGYDGGMFDGSGAFLSYLKGPLPIGDIDEVRKGLMRDYVQRLLRAFGGKAALQNKLDEGFKQPPFKEHPHHTTEFLASALCRRNSHPIDAVTTLCKKTLVPWPARAKRRTANLLIPHLTPRGFPALAVPLCRRAGCAGREDHETPFDHAHFGRAFSGPAAGCRGPGGRDAFGAGQHPVGGRSPGFRLLKRRAT